MGRKIYISHSKGFELVSPTRVLSSGYLSLLFKYGGSVGKFKWHDNSHYSYNYDSESENYVITARVYENTSYFDNDWGPDTDPENWYDLVEFLKTHHIDSTVDASNVVNLTPDREPRSHGYRCSGYHLINISCPFMSEDDALDQFNKDTARWEVESSIMDKKYEDAKERRKKNGIKKRKDTMARKREEKETAKNKAESFNKRMEERKVAISNGKSVGNVRGLSALGDRLAEMWGNDDDFITKRSLVMCDGINLDNINLNTYTLPFGKHRGLSLSSIKDNYCEWLFGCKVDGIMSKGDKPDSLYYHLVKFFQINT